MSLQIGCPKCGKQLMASPALVGKVVACPRCANRFRIGPVAEPNCDVGNGDVGNGSVGNGSVGNGSVGNGGVGEPAPINPDFYPPGAGPKPVDRSSTPALAQKPAAPKPTNAHHTARFIQRDPNATQVQLGKDGQLPDLALNQEKKRDDAVDGPKSSSPLLLIGALCISVLMSVLILVIDEPVAGTSMPKVEARRTLERWYGSWEPDEPADREILALLALAIQAYNRGDLEQERQYYRRALDLFNSEDAPRYGGYSGDDESIKDALSELLR